MENPEASTLFENATEKVLSVWEPFSPEPSNNTSESKLISAVPIASPILDPECRLNIELNAPQKACFCKLGIALPDANNWGNCVRFASWCNEDGNYFAFFGGTELSVYHGQTTECQKERRSPETQGCNVPVPRQSAFPS